MSNCVTSSMNEIKSKRPIICNRGVLGRTHYILGALTRDRSYFTIVPFGKFHFSRILMRPTRCTEVQLSNFGIISVSCDFCSCSYYYEHVFVNMCNCSCEFVICMRNLWCIILVHECECELCGKR
jgi:hypothetical protein